MSAAPLTQAQRATIIQYAAWLFGAGLVVGLVFTFEAIGHVAAWPLLPPINFDFPGTEAGWRRAHLGLIINAIAMLAFAAVATTARFGSRGRAIYVVSVIVTGYANSLGFLTGTLFGVRGLEFGGAAANTATYLFFLVAVVTGFAQAGLLAAAAATARRSGGAE
ncbi:hypothetical protein E4T66_00695 [Sinimarinibacterium sp. CAU 1509]|uniref:hypothetical protein n=1 Tax=Sinimarinibacterium sp. CAU 1509 TaxID=2562283 RepID=UPI0010AC7327|nr:hypothetical protein [Sinimarinibacterium sp. CAU 1509]TJY64796.1 hypothetical protein E4T66_00695 [Sinimarinibacterium sp. CAU 1509]